MRQLTYDDYENIIRKAQLKATGADIHDVNGMIGYLRAMLEYMKAGRNHLDQKIVDMVLYNSSLVLSKFIEGEGTINELKKKYIKEW